MSNITPEEVKQIAYLARLEFSSAELPKFEKELSNILGYVDILAEVDTKKVEPTAQVTGLTDIYRADERIPSKINRDNMLLNAPEKKDGYIKVKPVLD